MNTKWSFSTNDEHDNTNKPKEEIHDDNLPETHPSSQFTLSNTAQASNVSYSSTSIQTAKPNYGLTKTTSITDSQGIDVDDDDIHRPLIVKSKINNTNNNNENDKYTQYQQEIINLKSYIKTLEITNTELKEQNNKLKLRNSELRKQLKLIYTSNI